MKRNLWKQVGLLGSMMAWWGGCAQPTTEETFTVRKIDSLPGRRDGTIRVRLSTPGNYAEADEALVVRYAQIIAVREATARQRQIAAARARATIQKIAAHPTTHPRKARYLAVKTESSAGDVTAASSKAPGPKAGGHSTASRHTAASVMIWDTQTQEIVGNKVYDLGTEPVSGTVARFETYTAEYVGSGL